MKDASITPDAEDVGAESLTPSPAPEPAPQPVQVPIEGVEPASATVQTDTDPEAPYGRKADGTPRAKPGRKGAGEPSPRLEGVTPAPPRPPKPAPAPPAVQSPLPINYTELGRTAANIWFNVGQLPFGEDWAPNTQEGEHEIVAGAFRDYFKAKNVTEIDPTIGLCLVLGGYALKRAAKPTARDKIKGAWLWLKSKASKR